MHTWCILLDQGCSTRGMRGLNCNLPSRPQSSHCFSHCSGCRVSGLLYHLLAAASPPLCPRRLGRVDSWKCWGWAWGVQCIGARKRSQGVTSMQCSVWGGGGGSACTDELCSGVAGEAYMCCSPRRGHGSPWCNSWDNVALSHLEVGQPCARLSSSIWFQSY